MQTTREQCPPDMKMFYVTNIALSTIINLSRCDVFHSCIDVCTPRISELHFISTWWLYEIMCFVQLPNITFLQHCIIQNWWIKWWCTTNHCCNCGFARTCRALSWYKEETDASFTNLDFTINLSISVNLLVHYLHKVIILCILCAAWVHSPPSHLL